MTLNGERMMLTYEEAIGLLPEGKQVSVWFNSTNGFEMVKQVHDRDVVLGWFKKEEGDTLHVGGNGPIAEHHAIVFFEEDRPWFVANDPEKMAAFLKLHQTGEDKQ